MPPIPNQQNSVPPPVLAPTNTSTTIKAVRIFLLVLIVIGLALIATQKLWVPKLVDLIVENQTPTVQALNTQKAPQMFQWVSLSKVQNPYYTEQNAVIYCRNVAMSNVDQSSFLVASTTNFNIVEIEDPNVFSRDNNHVYFCHDGGIDPDPQFQVPGVAIVAGADPTTFIPIFNSMGYFTSFAKDKNNVYTVYGGTAIVLKDADPSTFISLGTINPFDSFFKDKNHVYTWSGVVDGADPNTFNVIFEATSSRAVYGKDANHVYYANGRGAQLISGADSATFVMLEPNGYYAKDSSHVYELGGLQTGVVNILPGANPTTFTVPLRQ